MARAIIDIGSNSVLLLIGSRRTDGVPQVVMDVARVARLSEGAGQSGRLKDEAITRTLAILADYVGIAQERGVDEIHAFATEGVRMAENADAFLGPAAATLGNPVQLVSGDEEARLSYLSVAHEQPPGTDLRVLDIGGGSTELVVGRGTEVIDACSHPVGSVRLTERHGAGGAGPVSPDVVEAIAVDARAAFATQPVTPAPDGRLFGLAGTVTTLAAVLLELPAYDREAVHGSTFARSVIEAKRDALAAMTLAERQAIPVVGPGRADVAVAGVTILLEAMAHTGAEQLCVADRGLRYTFL